MSLRKKLSGLTAAVMMTATAAALPATVVSAQTYDSTGYANGDLAAGDVVEIDSFEELCYFSDYVNGGGVTEGITWQLTADIDAADAFSAYTPIAADASYSFKGIFDGNGCTISGLSNVSSLFGYLYEAEVYDLTIADSQFYNASGNAAGLALQTEGTNISYVTVKDTDITAVTGNAGGIAAFVNAPSGVSASTFLACQFIGNGTITNQSSSSFYTGGIVGTTQTRGGTFTIHTCYNAADISGGTSVASGIVANLSYGMNVYNSLSVGSINSSNYYVSSGTFTDTYQLPSTAESDNASGMKFNVITDDMVSSGEVAYTMENIRKSSDVETSVYWTQNLASDSVPTLSTSDEYLVYYVNDTYTNESSDTPEFDTPEMIKKFSNYYYQINTYSELCWFSNAINNGTAETANAVLAADIVADSDSVWTPIGKDSSAPYTGIFDGDRYTVSGLNVTEGTNVGLFGYTSGAAIQYVGIENSSFAGTIYVAALAGVAVNSTIVDCYAYNNAINCNSTCSGFVASAQNSSITSSYTDSDKGLIGGGSSTVAGCYHAGTTNYGTIVTADQISNGYVAYMLKQYNVNASLTNNWGQDLSENNSHPVLDTNYEVFCTGQAYDNASPSEHSPENVVCNSDGTHQYDCSYCLENVIESCRYSDGFCSICGYFDNDSEYIVYHSAGTYTLPTPKSTSATEQVVGWIDAEGLLHQCGASVTVSDTATLHKVTLDLNTVGASARLNNDSTGIRFATQLDITGADFTALNISIGTLICPTDYVTNDSVLDYDYFVEKGYIVISEDISQADFTEITVNDTAYDNAYFGSIININAYNYAREFTGCGFIKVTYSDNSIAYFYATSKSSQSIYSLAAKAYGDRSQTADDNYTNETVSIDTGDIYYSRYNDDELAVLEGFIDGVVNFDIDLANKGSAQLVIPDEIASFYEPAYSAVVDYTANVITITGTAEGWSAYLSIQKSSGAVEYQRVAVMINGKRITYGNDTDNFEIPVSVVDADNDMINSDTMYINIVGIE